MSACKFMPESYNSEIKKQWMRKTYMKIKWEEEVWIKTYTLYVIMWNKHESL